jgi:hypothetical protein
LNWLGFMLTVSMQSNVYVVNVPNTADLEGGLTRLINLAKDIYDNNGHDLGANPEVLVPQGTVPQSLKAANAAV